VVAPNQALHLTRPADLVFRVRHVSRQAVGVPGRAGELGRSTDDLLLVDYTGRLFRQGKTVISAELAGVFDRLRISAESWQARLHALCPRLTVVLARLTTENLARQGTYIVHTVTRKR